MRILITGSRGQLGQEFVRLFADEEILSTDKDTLGITDAKKVEKVFKKFKPQIVLHAAAYTQVEKAESERELAFLVNEKGTFNVTKAAYKIGADLVYISTDYVFDGAKNSPYTEEDVPCPINAYGLSKLKGEEAVQKIYGTPNSRSSIWLIVRTSWLYGPTSPLDKLGATRGKPGGNFVKTILGLSKEKDKIEVVADQIGSPTWARDLAKAIKSLLKHNQSGIFHASGRGATSWFEFAKEIIKLSRRPDITSGVRDPDTQRSSGKTKIVPITSDKLKSKVKRPAYSYLSCKKLEPIFKMPDWRVSLKQYLSSNIKGTYY